MKYQLFCLIELFKKKYYKLLILFIFLSIMIVMVSYLSNYEFNNELFKSVLGISSVSPMLGYLWILFQIVFHCYVTYLFFEYEKNNSFEFIILREAYVKIIIKKIIWTVICIFIFRTLYFLFVYFIFKDRVSATLCVYVKSIIIYLIVSIGTGIITTAIHSKK